MKLIFTVVLIVFIISSCFANEYSEFNVKRRQLIEQLETEFPQIFTPIWRNRKTSLQVKEEINALVETLDKISNIPLPKKMSQEKNIFLVGLGHCNLHLASKYFAIADFDECLETYNTVDSYIPNRSKDDYNWWACKLFQGEFVFDEVEGYLNLMNEEGNDPNIYLYLAYINIFVGHNDKLNEILDKIKLEGKQRDFLLFSSHLSIQKEEFNNAIIQWKNYNKIVLENKAYWRRIHLLEIETIIKELINNENQLLVGIFMEMSDETERGVEFFNAYLKEIGVHTSNELRSLAQEKYSESVVDEIMEFYERAKELN